MSGGRSSVLVRVGSLVLVVALACLVAACGGTTGSTGAPEGSGAAPTGSALTLRDAWVRAAPAGGLSAGYLTISNDAAADALVGASAPDVTDRASVHETTTGDDGMTGMHHTPSVAIPAGGSLVLQPGGVHVMLEDLKQDLVAGDTVRLQLTFEHAGVLEVDAQVRSE
jgi:copper(I)-binding protein